MHRAKKPIEANNYSPLEIEQWSSLLVGALADPIECIDDDNEERLGQSGSEDWPEVVDAPRDQSPFVVGTMLHGIRAIGVGEEGKDITACTVAKVTGVDACCEGHPSPNTSPFCLDGAPRSNSPRYFA